MRRRAKIGTCALALMVAAALGGCGAKSAQPQVTGGSTETEAKAQYNETKSMVLDILHTKEGLDTLKDIVRDPAFKQSLSINETDVQVAMQKALTDGSAHVTLMEQMKNPKFATAIASSYKKDNAQILKDLMKDPEYQEMMLTLLKSPDFQNTLYDLMKTPQYRKQTMDIMTQSLQNPQFRLMFLEIVKEAIHQGSTEMTPNQKKQTGQDQAQMESTGGGGGGGGDQKEGEEKQDQEKKKNESSGDEKKESSEDESGGGSKK